MRELGYRAKYEAWSVGIYAANASDQAFFTSAVCNTRLRKRSVNRVLSVIVAWLDSLAAILQTLALRFASQPFKFSLHSYVRRALCGQCFAMLPAAILFDETFYRII